VYFLDTNICVALIKANPVAKQKFNQKAIECYISSLVLAELYKGVYCSQQSAKNLVNVRNFLTLVGVIEFDQSAAEEFGRIQAELRQLGKPTGEIDALIGAVARSRQAILVTNNLRHFENIPRLLIENWLNAES
jgi:tRNA(fMet)-specific endonuclease VapC